MWERYPSIEELGELRMASMNEFLSDYAQGKVQGRYVRTVSTEYSPPCRQLADLSDSPVLECLSMRAAGRGDLLDGCAASGYSCASARSRNIQPDAGVVRRKR